MRAEALKGHLETLLLAIVDDAPAHGYAIIEELRRRSSGTFDLPEGTVYPALHRLERAGLLTSRWDAAAPRRRRVYRLTTRGHRALGRGRTEWQAFTSAVDVVLGGAA